MTHRSEGFTYPEVAVQTYKDEPGTWVSVTRRELFPESNTGFETRYFEIGPGGYTSFEKHVHEHCVVVLRGSGRVRLGDDWREVSLGDTVLVESLMPHQFQNPSLEPFGILCIVDRERDRPTLLDSSGNVRTSDA